MACLADPLSPIMTPMAIFTFFVYHIKPQNLSLIDEYFFSSLESGSTQKKEKDMDHGLPFSRFGLYLTDTTATALHNTISCGPFLSPFGP